MLQLHLLRFSSVNDCSIKIDLQFSARCLEVLLTREEVHHQCTRCQKRTILKSLLSARFAIQIENCAVVELEVKGKSGKSLNTFNHMVSMSRVLCD